MRTRAWAIATVASLVGGSGLAQGSASAGPPPVRIKCTHGTRRATAGETSAATRVVATSVHVAELYLLNPQVPRNAKRFAQTIPKPEPFNTYRRHASTSRLPLKEAHLDDFWRFGACVRTRGDRDSKNDVTEIGVGAYWTIYGDTHRLRPWPYLGTSFQFSVVGIYTILRGRIVGFERANVPHL